VEYKWRKPQASKERVLVAGTFDLLHPGHIYILRKAWELGDVYVVVARDKNVTRFKGRPPIIPEAQRLEMVRNIKWVHDAILGDEEDIIKSVERIRPTVILLGPDQPIRKEELKRELKKRGLNPKIIKLKRRNETFPLSSTSAIIRRIFQIHRKHPLLHSK